MNLMGKMFITMIFILSVMFMAFSIVIYSTHTNWKNVAEKRKAELTAADTKAKQAIAERDEIIAQKEEEAINKANAIATLQTKLAEMEKDNDQSKEELARLKEKEARQLTEVAKIHDTLHEKQAENESLRTAFRDSQTRWFDMCTQLVTKTDEANALSLRLATFRSVGKKLAQDYKDAVAVLKQHGLKPLPNMYTGTPPKDVRGLVTEVRPNGWIEISIGEDSGIMKGHRLDIVRKIGDRSSYVGKLEVIRTEPDRAAAQILPEYRRGTVQQNDIVENLNINELSAK